MLLGDIHSTLLVLIKLGGEIKLRLNALNQAAEDLQLLTTNLRLLLTVFENPANEAIIKAHVSEFVTILDILQSITMSCAKCAKALDIDSAKAKPANDSVEAFGRRIIRRIWILNRIPSLLAEIQHKAEHLHKVYSAVSVVILQDIRANQSPPSTGAEVSTASTVVERESKHMELHDSQFTTNFASIDLILGNLMTECKSLRKQLQENVIRPDSLSTQHYQTQNPEGLAFWRDRFQKSELGPSSLRYETLYVSWARFVHEIEISLVLNNIPTATFETATIDVVREGGHRFSIDLRGTRCLPTIRPLWLPALQTALDPLRKGYVKPQEYFHLLQDLSLSATLRRLVLDSCGYGVVVECERATSDLSLPASLESSLDHVGWIAAQIVAVPTPGELGVTTDREVMEASGEDLISCFNNTARDIYVHVRYLQTGQIEIKSLQRQIRGAGGISIGAAIAIRYELESGKHAWSSDTIITEFSTCKGGAYNITAGSGRNVIPFSTVPFVGSFDDMLHDEGETNGSTLPYYQYTLLGPSRAFWKVPGVGEKVQIEYDGLWYDSRVTEVDGDEIEFVDWDAAVSDAATPSVSGEQDGETEECDFGGLFSEEQLERLGRGTRRLWCPWKRDIARYDVRPYRCLHIGDSIEAPVMYPDYLLRYHRMEESQLYIPARIAEVHGDQYLVEFSPAICAHKWWPGRLPCGALVELLPGSPPGDAVENPYDANRVMMHADLVRPLSSGGGARPVLGAQSAQPAGWNSFQGVQLRNLEDLLEQSLWNDDKHGTSDTG
ncbi:hypothetical protein ISF_08647 [Cordyceps fumosorosea ARSEF 2679]|uniref:Uncharacterized protein n=1 Tax=Cordyceps fumosorosea (strain ARSEF 2679) TaxID=1081104 RepID=A0A162K5R9_CORFA|nr:hypothetical protein ISF_08647 [Cordyceps fumosorosea ARSEF 2679]OAA53708.1 hypothetical protein ISF_08647 [Cordyceps fumosorosea ARSEF 2679]